MLPRRAKSAISIICTRSTFLFPVVARSVYGTEFETFIGRLLIVFRPPTLSGNFPQGGDGHDRDQKQAVPHRWHAPTHHRRRSALLPPAARGVAGPARQVK